MNHVIDPKVQHERNLLVAIAQLVTFGKLLSNLAKETESPEKNAQLKLVGNILSEKMVNKIIIPFMEIVENKEATLHAFEHILKNEIKQAFGPEAEIELDLEENKKNLD